MDDRVVLYKWVIPAFQHYRRIRARLLSCYIHANRHPPFVWLRNNYPQMWGIVNALWDYEGIPAAKQRIASLLARRLLSGGAQTFSVLWRQLKDRSR